MDDEKTPKDITTPADHAATTSSIQETAESVETSDTDATEQPQEEQQLLKPDGLPLPPDARIELASPLYNRNELSGAEWAKASELERRHFRKLLDSPWYLEQPPQFQEAIKRFPPFNLYKLRDTGHVAFITEYHQVKDDNDAPIVVTVRITPEYNKGTLAFVDETGSEIAVNKTIFGVPQSVLEPMGLRSVFDAQRWLQHQAQLPFMQQIATRKGQLEKSKRQSIIRRGN